MAQPLDVKRLLATGKQITTLAALGGMSKTMPSVIMRSHCPLSGGLDAVACSDDSSQAASDDGDDAGHHDCPSGSVDRADVAKHG
jgi:hypothetical protein